MTATTQAFLALLAIATAFLGALAVTKLTQLLEQRQQPTRVPVRDPDDTDDWPDPDPQLPPMH